MHFPGMHTFLYTLSGSSSLKKLQQPQIQQNMLIWCRLYCTYRIADTVR